MVHAKPGWTAGGVTGVNTSPGEQRRDWKNKAKSTFPLAGIFTSASNLVAASESAIADIKLKSGRRIGRMPWQGA